MTDKEAYELLVKYGGEKSISMAKEMIHIAGIEKAIENTIWAYEKQYKNTDQDFKDWIRQAYTYMIESTTITN